MAKAEAKGVKMLIPQGCYSNKGNSRTILLSM